MQNPKITNYIDDIFGLIKFNKENLWNDINVFIKQLNKYVNDNELLNNLSETKIMIIDKNVNLKNISHT